ncbi:MAG: TIGR04282 family arsenosugar biosynthesis glycosyltransferase [Leeuwenhoekiella sp.]
MENLLLIFTRNPELGKCKTRLAATVGDKAALNIYTFLLRHTVKITKDLPVDKQVCYSERIRENDLWDASVFAKCKQQGDDLGQRMYNAFAQAFAVGYKKVIIIGSDMYDLNSTDLKNAFDLMDHNDVVVGPATDGGYYLLGMTQLNKNLFLNKDWGNASVLSSTLADLKTETVALLDERNDVDYYEDIADIAVFKKFFPKTLQTR